MILTTEKKEVQGLKKSPSFIRSQRLGIRTTSSQAALIKLAAELKGKSVTDFILSSACETAEQIILNQRIFITDENAWKAFNDILDRPVKENKKLKKLITAPPVWGE